MVHFQVRKMMVFSESIFHENGPPPETPRRRGAIVAVVSNPFAGIWQEDLQSEMDNLKPLGLKMTDELIKLMGGIGGIDGYGKAALAGEGGELEHTALWHVPGGYSMRKRLGEAKAIVPSSMKVGGPGTPIDIPLGHINAAYVRSHFDAMEVRLPDAPRAGELMFALAMTRGARIHNRMGGLQSAEVKGEDGLRQSRTQFATSIEEHHRLKTKSLAQFYEYFDIIDPQNDFCPGGALAVEDGDEIIIQINDMMSGFDLIILTQDWHPTGHSSFASSHNGHPPFSIEDMPYGSQTLWLDQCVAGSNGAAFHPKLYIDRANAIIRKGMNPSADSYSAFVENDKVTQTGLAGFLKARGSKELTIVGLATDFCVCWSALDGVHSGFNVKVVLSACRAFDLDGSLKTAFATMQNAGVDLLE